MKNPHNNLLFPDRIQDYVRKGRAKADFNFGTHEQLHAPKVMTYTSKATLVTTVGSRMYPYRGGQIIRARANVQTGPTSSFVWKILKNGTSVHSSSPTIGAGLKFAAVTEFIENGYFVPDDYFQVQITTIDAAVGPLVVLIEYLPADFY